MVAAVALPPVSRKLAAGEARRRAARTSHVFMARPAPLTRVPIRRGGGDGAGAGAGAVAAGGEGGVVCVAGCAAGALGEGSGM